MKPIGVHCLHCHKAGTPLYDYESCCQYPDPQPTGHMQITRYSKLFIACMVLFLAMPAWSWLASLISSPSSAGVAIGFLGLGTLCVAVLLAITEVGGAIISSFKSNPNA